MFLALQRSIHAFGKATNRVRLVVCEHAHGAPYPARLLAVPACGSPGRAGKPTHWGGPDPRPGPLLDRYPTAARPALAPRPAPLSASSMNVEPPILLR
jgi:hypothetical protein